MQAYEPESRGAVLDNLNREDTLSSWRHSLPTARPWPAVLVPILRVLARVLAFVLGFLIVWELTR